MNARTKKTAAAKPAATQAAKGITAANAQMDSTPAKEARAPRPRRHAYPSGDAKLELVKTVSTGNAKALAELAAKAKADKQAFTAAYVRGQSVNGTAGSRILRRAARDGAIKGYGIGDGGNCMAL